MLTSECVYDKIYIDIRGIRKGDFMLKKIMCIAAAVVISVFGFFFVRDNVGVSAEKLETDARKSQQINGDWLVSESCSDKIAAMVFYPESLDEHTFSVYVKGTGISYGYFFKAGGSIFMDDYVVEFRFNDAAAYLSMNKINISKIEVVYPDKTEIVEIDSEKPFAFALPDNAVRVDFYDTDGNIAEIKAG